MSNRQTGRRTTPTDEFHKFVPATTSIHVPKTDWNGLGLNLYTFFGDNDGTTPPPGIPDYGLAFLTAGYGKGYYQFNNSNWTPGKVYPKIAWYLQPYSSLGWQWRSEDVSDIKPQVVNIHIDASIMKQTALQVFEKDDALVEMPNALAVYDELLHTLALELLNEAQNQTPYGKLFGETAGQLMAIQLLRKYCTIDYKIREYKGGLPRKTLNQVLDYIAANLNRNISLESLSILTGLSSYHLARQFKQSTGLAPHQYFVQCRIDKAKELLKHTNLSIAQITLEIGYESQSHFTTLFKRLTGVTPKSWREQV